MTALPSFVELMATLGLDQTTKAPEQSPSSPHSSPSSSPRLGSITAPSPTRSKSSPSLRDLSTSRTRVARYSPYSPVISSRRSSLSSASSSSPELEWFPLPICSTSPQQAPIPARRRSRNKLTVNVYGSATDLAANTPISTYVRRKTPGTSPTSPTFSREARCDLPSDSPVPVTLPTLPPLFPLSANSDSSFPLTPNSESEQRSPPHTHLKTLPDVSELGNLTHRARRHTGVRISTPPVLLT